MARSLLITPAHRAYVMQKASVSEIARAIAAYVENNPEAQDTLEGIVQWWLPEGQNQVRTALIREALDELIAEGLITAYKAKDAQIFYRATRRAREPDEFRSNSD